MQANAIQVKHKLCLAAIMSPVSAACCTVGNQLVVEVKRACAYSCKGFPT
jgi:hypothetical protein